MGTFTHPNLAKGLLEGLGCGGGLVGGVVCWYISGLNNDSILLILVELSVGGCI